MALTDRPAIRRYVLIALAVVVVLGLAGLVAYLVATAVAGGDCSPEARQEAISRDASDVLSGRIRLDVAYDREAARIERCES